MKRFICDCVNPDFKGLGLKDVNDLIDIIDNSKEINKQEFLKNCEVEENLKKSIKEFPNDFGFFRNGNILFFTHSMVEHFYK